MNERSHWREWPLAVFTVAVQFACGLAFAATILDWQARPGEEELAQSLALSVFPVVALGILVSLLHLGRPLSVWKALTNAGQSRLSQEVLIVGAFAVNALVYGAMWWNDVTGPRLACGLSTIALGVLAVFAAARVYRIPAEPVWHSGWVPVSFFGTALLLGGLFPLLHEGIQTPVFAVATLAGSTTVVLSVVLMLYEYFNAQADLEQMRTAEWVLTAVQLVSAGVAPTAILFARSQVYSPSSSVDISWIVYPAFALVVTGITMGRITMFAMRRDRTA